jgi:FlaA1/EpsC-like NDP-sugar epimerase
MTRPSARQIVIDFFLLFWTPFAAFAIRSESFRFTPEQEAMLLKYAIGALLVRLAVNRLAGAYRAMWRYASALDVWRLLAGVAASSAVCIVHGGLTVRLLPPATPRLPLAAVLLDCGLAATMTLAPRVWMRLWQGKTTISSSPGISRMLIVGAGRLGQILMQDLRFGSVNLLPVGFVDDDPKKLGRHLAGVPVVGNVAALGHLIAHLRADTVVIALRQPSGALVRQVFDSASAAGITAQVLPAPGEVATGKRSVSALRTVDIDDLLRRPRVDSGSTHVKALVAGRCVVVTGAGGSIGSELSSQCANFGPRRLVLLDLNEDGIYHVERRLRQQYPTLDIVPLVMDVRDRSLLRRAFAEHRPDLVYHAAAYKHVPLMESNSLAALVNNVGGALELFAAAEAAGVQRVVTISSDKAVDPSSVMGFTKLLTELMMRRRQHAGRTTFSAVRFGNVLGSRGSVVPLFLEQIQTSRRITVTHPEMTRYFMVTAEAVGLVLQASVLQSAADVFVLDMGKPVRIVDLATDLIRLSGLVPHEDVEIVFTGLRPGEKMHEGLTTAGETLRPTSVAGVTVIARTVDSLNSPLVGDRLDQLAEELLGDRRDAQLGALAQQLAAVLGVAWKWPASPA